MEKLEPPYKPSVWHLMPFQTGNDKDVTMKAGKRKNAIPIIRRFNDHSERLLQSALWVWMSFIRMSADDISARGTNTSKRRGASAEDYVSEVRNSN